MDVWPALLKFENFSWPCALELSRKDKTPVREAPGVAVAMDLGHVLGLEKKPVLLSVHGPASGSRSSSAGMNRIKFVGFANRRSCNHFSHLSAFAHPGAGCSIASSGALAAMPY